MTEATFLFADLAGYTALTESHGDEYAADVAAGFAAAIRETLEGYTAQEVKRVGDGVLIRAEDADQALHLAARLICDFGARHRALGVRVGMHTGSAVARDGDWYGQGVNLASRVLSAAEPGEVVLTAATRDAVGGAVLPGQLRPRGRKALKNVREPVELFALIPEGMPDDRRLPIDPVCHMTIDPDRAGETLVHDGTEYAFCSETCAKAFLSQPRRYVRGGGAGAGLLVSDEARHRVAGRLARAYQRGRLTQDELEEHMAAVWAARTRYDLRAITGDIPSARRRRAPWWVFGPVGPFVLLARRVRRWRHARLRARREPPRLEP